MTIDYTSFNGGQMNKLAAEAKWWKLKGMEMAQAICAVVNTLVQSDGHRQSQFQTSLRLYGNANLVGLNGLTFSKMQKAQSSLKDRISYNVVQAGIDTVTAKMIKNKPKPLYLTSGGDWKMQRRAEKLSKFTDGIFYENHTYDLGRECFRDAGVLADGFVHVFEEHGRVKHERVLAGELVVDQQEALYGEPRQLHRTKQVDRAVLLDLFPSKAAIIKAANVAKLDLAGTYRSISDLVNVVESWHLPSGPEAGDGCHAIALENDVLFVEPWERDYFPFARMPWNTRLYGYWSQSGVEQVQNIQLEINKLLWVIQRSMHMAGTMKILAERGAKIVREHFTNEFATILEYTGVKPDYIVPPIVPPEIYAHLDRLKGMAFETLGVSQLSAAGQKPMGLDSGRALREMQDIETERFTALGQQYEEFFLDIARMSIDVAKDIFERDGKYEVKLPGKKFLETIDWADVDLDEDEYVMKVFPVSSLPNDPAGRLQTIQEYIQAGFMTPRAGRRLLDFPDLEQAEAMANSKEDWLHEVFEKMIDEGEDYTLEPEDDAQLAKELVLEYIAFAKVTKVPEDRLQLLRDFLTRLNDQMLAASQAMQPAQPTPQAQAAPPPVSNMIPNVPGAAAA